MTPGTLVHTEDFTNIWLLLTNSFPSRVRLSDRDYWRCLEYDAYNNLVKSWGCTFINHSDNDYQTYT